MKPWALILSAAALLSGCAGQQIARTPPPPHLFQDQLFQPAKNPVDTERVFAVTPEMRTYLRREVNENVDKDVRRQLFDALYRRDKLQLEYDSAMTRNAAQTFEARAGNCLSLAIMTAALAQELHLKVQFQQVQVEEAWSRSGNLYFASNHVNLLLGTRNLSRSPFTGGYTIDLADSLTVDFIPIPPKVRENAKPLEDYTVLAMYLNNRAAEMLANGQVDDAYWAARKSAETDPEFLNAYNTLGVIYQHHGDLAAAEASLRYALSQAPNNTIYLSNLVQTLLTENKQDEAGVLRERLAKLEPYPPFYFFNLGQDAMRQGDYVRARDMFRRELDRAPDYHEFHFWLAVADYQLGDLRAADKHMTEAMKNSTTRGDHDLYAAKLDRIKAYEAHAK